MRAYIQKWWKAERVRFTLEQAAQTGTLGRFEYGLLIVAAIGLTVMNFFGLPHVFNAIWGPFHEYFRDYWDLLHLCHWVLGCILGYLIIPIAYLKSCGRSLQSYYLGFKGLRVHPWGYIALLIPTSVLVIWVSFWPDFQSIYPFYLYAHRSWFDLVAWEFVYGLQFFALEFFFRAFLLEGLRPAIGYGAIPVMVMPYCMIHFLKTPAESLGSIVAGLILGWMAMRGRSIWGGVLLHWFIAIEMDVLSLWQQGRLPSLFQ